MSDPGRHEFDTLDSTTIYTGAIIALRKDSVVM
ncbi:ADP-ribose pyrophosphatase, partial [Rhodococcus globerulus]|nr:ADP-ribose pyrophosphatase [Rhodococcus globerulus]